MIQAVIVDTPVSLGWANTQVQTISTTQLISMLYALPSLVELSLFRLTLLPDNGQAHHPRRSLQRLSLVDVTNATRSWNPMHEIIAFTSLFESVDNLHVSVDAFFAMGPGREHRRHHGPFRRDTSWMADVTTSLPIKTLHITGPPTTHLHTLKFLRMADAFHTLNSMQFSMLDPAIIVEIEAILNDNPSRIESLSLGFNPNVHSFGSRLGQRELVKNTLLCGPCCSHMPLQPYGLWVTDRRQCITVP